MTTCSDFVTNQRTVDALADSCGTERFERLVRENYDSLWRLARRLGLSTADADDVSQRAVMVVSRRLGEIAPGCERSFLYRALLFLANKCHRDRRRRAEEAVLDWEELGGSEPDPEQLLEKRRALATLDAIIAQLPEELRAAFVLFELELLTQVEVAMALEIPQGTVASRVRRARELVTAMVERTHRKNERIGGCR